MGLISNKILSLELGLYFILRPILSSDFELDATIQFVGPNRPSLQKPSNTFSTFVTFKCCLLILYLWIKETNFIKIKDKFNKVKETLTLCRGWDGRSKLFPSNNGQTDKDYDKQLNWNKTRPVWTNFKIAVRHKLLTHNNTR